ncbi:3-hexulose-6-phosphate isomerase [Leifsonia sp. Leaf325]|nr:6-phospho-3-hexuloisomerase [Leifsonia sp. Leaf325]KQQ93835.1 3-hexulose-6-phosphate isomerase [Leifsonia sp. Leaf325]
MTSTTDAPPTGTPGTAEALGLVARELSESISHLAQNSAGTLDELAALVSSSRRIFVLGGGRSGLALEMTAMRLMHLGLPVHVVGEVTAPAIGAGDLLLTASGSGTTGSVVRAGHTAVEVGAAVAVLTTAADSPLARLASVAVIVPAAGKLDRTGAASAQYAGSLFEQSVVVIGDALFHALWQRSGLSADDLWPRHANLE